MLPTLALLLLQDGAATTAPVLQPADSEVGIPLSGLAALEAELVELHAQLRPYLVEVRGTVMVQTEHGLQKSKLLVSGVVIDWKGRVVAPGPLPGGSVEMVRYDGETVRGEVIAEDARTGLVLIQAEGLEIPAPRLGRSDTLRVGSLTVALGNAYGLQASFSLGMLAGKGRRVGEVEGLLQVSNPVNPGDGGGLLADRQGRVVGVLLSSLREAAQRQAAGQGRAATGAMLQCEMVSFAIPIELVIAGFHEHLDVDLGHRPHLGVVVELRTSPPQDARGGGNVASWLIVSEVQAGSAAARAGLQVGDQLISLDGRPLRTLECLEFALANANGVTPVQFRRGGREETRKLKLALADHSDNTTHIKR
ncbi:MAG TPA: S1C family serine protease [Planctomycetota bacterium]